MLYVPGETNTWSGAPVATVDLAALRHNVRQIRTHLRAGCGVLGVVKANAYGHGAIAVANALADGGVEMLGVARIDEAVELREAGIRAPILVMAGVSAADAETVWRHDLRVTLFDLSSVTALAREAIDMQAPIRVHVKVDTGMGRLGFNPADAPGAFAQIASHPGLAIEGLMTHFADAEGDPEYTAGQLGRLRSLMQTFEASGTRPPLVHAANSAAALSMPDAQLDMVRPGIAMYGYAPEPWARALDLRPVLSLSARVLQVSHHADGATIGYGRTFTVSGDRRIAVLSVGYADGISRRLSNCGRVLIRGVAAPIVGRVCMDMLMVDVTGHERVDIGDEAILIGGEGGDAITAQTLADLTGAIPYEVLCAIGPRVRRVTVDSPYRGWSR